jgi:hypothetical protein
MSLLPFNYDPNMVGGQDYDMNMHQGMGQAYGNKFNQFPQPIGQSLDAMILKPAGSGSGFGSGSGKPMQGQPTHQVRPAAGELVMQSGVMQSRPAAGSAAAKTQDDGGFWGGISSLLGPLVGIGSVAGAIDNAGDIRQLGNNLQKNLEEYGKQLNAGSQFHGYGVTSGLGSTTVDSDGSVNLGVGPNGAMINRGHQNMTGSSSAFNDALGQDSGQTAMDFNAQAGSQMGQSSGMNPNFGGYLAEGRQLFNQARELDPNEGWAGDAAQEAAGRSLADPSQRQGEIFDQLMAIQNPALNRQQAQQQAREFAMGRGGVRGSGFGGTAEDAAMARARADASNQAALNAMQQADSERSMFGQMASQYGQLGNQRYNSMSNQMSNLLNASNQRGQVGNQTYGAMSDRANQLANSAYQMGSLGNQATANATANAGMLGQIGAAMGKLGLDQHQMSYLPMEMQMKLAQLGQGNAEMAQTGQLTGQDYLAQMLLGGTNANVNAQKVSSELMGNLYDSILDNLGGSSNADGTGSTGLFSVLENLGGLLGLGG